MESKILIVESDCALVREFMSELVDQGYDVSIASSGVEALNAMQGINPDIVVLDPSLSWDGEHKISEINNSSELSLIKSVILLNPKTTESKIIKPINFRSEDREKGVFDIKKVISHIKQLHQQSKNYSNKVLKAGILELDENRWTVTVNNKTPKLTKKEFEILRMFLKSKGRVLTRRMILENIWGYESTHGFESRTVDVHIGRLRRKLGPAGKYIVTLRNVGYYFGILPELIVKNNR